MVGTAALIPMTQQAALAFGPSLRMFDGDLRPGQLVGFARGCDVLTIVDDRVPIESVAALEADGCTVHPGADALRRAREFLVVEDPADRTLAVVLARSPFGQGAVWQVAERGAEIVAPAPGLDGDTAGAAQALALRIADELKFTGVLTV